MAGKEAPVADVVTTVDELPEGAVEIASADMAAVLTEALRNRGTRVEDRIITVYDGGMGSTVFIFERFTETPRFPEDQLPYLETSEGKILRGQARFIGGDLGGYWLHIGGVLASFMSKTAPEGTRGGVNG